MVLESMDREHVIISGLSPAWVEAHKVSVENYGIVINKDYMPGTDVVELKNPLLSSLDLLYALEYIAHDRFVDYLWIGKIPMTADNVQAFFFPCVQDVLNTIKLNQVAKEINKIIPIVKFQVNRN